MLQRPKGAPQLQKKEGGGGGNQPIKQLLICDGFPNQGFSIIFEEVNKLDVVGPIDNRPSNN